MKPTFWDSFRGWVIATELLLVLTLFALFYNFYLPLGTQNKSLYFDDTDLSNTLRTLQRHGYDINDIDYLIAPLFISPKTGWYRIVSQTPGGRLGFFTSLFARPARTMQLYIYGGDATEDILTRLASDTKLPLVTLQNAAKALNIQEGDILAGRYTVARDTDAYGLLDALLRMSHHRVVQTFRKHGWQLPEPYARRILFTVASVIQKETRHTDEMPLIASVIYNRLAEGMKLQMDGTLNYGPYSHVPVTPERIRTDMSRFNTYRYKGLPPAVVGAFSPEALEAAIYPATTDYLFFMLQRNGKHHFSTTYQEHIRYLKSYRKKHKKR